MNIQNEFLTIKIEDIIPSQHQPRKVFNKSSLEELSNSIKNYGILNPILVKKNAEKYEIISGERRVKAAKLAGLTQVPARVLSIDDKKIIELAMAENLQRENISPIEEARSFEQIMNDNDLKEEELIKVINKNQNIINNRLKLLNLPENIQRAVNERKIGERHARSLMKVSDDAKKAELLNKIITEKLTVKELNNIIDEEEITDALQDITKELSNNIEEKEEKESDIMNNGNFFQNITPNSTPEFNPINEINRESNPMGTPTPDFSVQTENVNNQLPPTETPLFTATSIPNAPGFDFSQTNEPQMPQTPEPIVNVAPETNNQMVPPLFNIEQPRSYEVPVENIQEIGLNEKTNVEKVQEVLNNNGINYKLYSNENGHCIIIEI